MLKVYLVCLFILSFYFFFSFRLCCCCYYSQVHCVYCVRLSRLVFEHFWKCVSFLLTIHTNTHEMKSSFAAIVRWLMAISNLHVLHIHIFTLIEWQMHPFSFTPKWIWMHSIDHEYALSDSVRSGSAWYTCFMLFGT